MYRYDDFDPRFVHQRAAQFRDQLERHLAGELAEDDFRAPAPAERLVRAAPRADAAHRRALRRAELEAAARAGPHRARVRRPRRRPVRRRGRLRPLHDAPELPVQLDRPGRRRRRDGRARRRRHARHPDQRQLHPQHHQRLLRRRRRRRDRRPAPVLRDPAPVEHAAPGVRVPAAQVQDRGQRRDRRPRRDRVARHRPRAAQERRRRDRLRGPRRRRHGPHADHRHGRCASSCRGARSWSSSRRSCASTTATAGATTCTRRGSRSWSRPRAQKFIDAVESEFQDILERDIDGSAHLLTDAELARVSACFKLPAGVAPIDERADCATAAQRGPEPSPAGSSATCTRTASPATAP